MEKKRKLIVLSADALISDDMDKLSELPNFKKYLSGGACVKKVRSIYPTITYPCHTTMVTGVYPDRHGVPGNLVTPYSCINSPIPWRWDHKYVRSPDLFDAAKKAGLTTAAVFWPVTGNHPSIDYLIDEYWTQFKGDSIEDAMRRMGTREELIPIITKNKHMLRERIHPDADYFVLSCACDIIREYKPDLLMIHPADIDGTRHQNGLFGSHIDKALADTDMYIGQLMKACEDAGISDEVSLVLTSDHGQMDIKRVININVYLADAGLIRPTDDPKKPDWDAWCQSGGMSALVYLKDKSNREIYEKTYSLLRHMCDEGIYGISRVFTEEEAREEEHYSEEFSFVLETDNYTAFGDRYTRPAVSPANNEDYRKGRATHGYLPSKGPSVVFYAKGPAFRENTVIDEGLLVDEAPTLAAALGIEMKNTDGRPMRELIR